MVHLLITCKSCSVNIWEIRLCPLTAANIPLKTGRLPKKTAQKALHPKAVPTLFYSVTTNDTTGAVYIKMVNTISKKQAVKINLDGIARVSSNATVAVVKGNKPEETNTINDPVNIVPVTTTVKGIGKSFMRTLDPYSVTILQLETGR